MATIADNIAELMRIKLEQRDYFGIGEDVPFAQYIDIMRWAGHEIPQQPVYADFVNHRYARDGKPCRFEDIFELIRLSKAWQFEGGKLEEYGINEPRFSGKGLLIEPESTNFMLNSTNPIKWFSRVTQESSEVESPVGVNGVRIKFLQNFTPIKDFTVNFDKVTSVLYGYLDTSDPTRVLLRDATQGVNLKNNTYNRDGNISADGYGKKDGMVFGGGSWDVISGNTHYNYLGATGNIKDLPIVWWANQFEGGDIMTSLIVTENNPATRLPETLTVLTDSEFTIEADEGIQVNGNEISGFGYIRKLEVK